MYLKHYTISLHIFLGNLCFYAPQLLQQATSTTNQSSFNGLQRLGGEFIPFRCQNYSEATTSPVTSSDAALSACMVLGSANDIRSVAHK